MLAGLLFYFTIFNASAQTKTDKGKITQQKATAKSNAKRSKKDSTVMMASTSNHPAFSSTAEISPRITDPTINAMNERAAGAPVPKKSSGIIGVPKYSNGFANGHVFLSSTTDT